MQTKKHLPNVKRGRWPGRDGDSKAFCRCLEFGIAGEEATAKGTGCRCPELGMAGEEAVCGKGDGLQMPRARPCQGLEGRHSCGVTGVTQSISSGES